MISGTNASKQKKSPYITFSRDSWKELRNSTPLTLKTSDLEEIRGLNENISLDEVVDIYLPLSRLLHLYYRAARELYAARREFLGIKYEKITFIIGIAGSVAVGKSTTARLLKTLISAWPEAPSVDLIPTDGFIFPNRILQERNIMNRKGFPESFNVKDLISFLYDLKSGIGDLKVPVYSHLLYDIVPGEYITVNTPDILILEGLNVLQSRNMKQASEPEFFVSDFFDFSIYLDADESDIKEWFIERFKVLMRTAFQKSESYFHSYSALDLEKAVLTAGKIWDEINAVNLRENIAPTKFHAHLILEKLHDHSIGRVLMRKI
ncbi:MAG: type I pantothenate kinase [Candidatus Thermoplasmatota archaeon]|nr:type I pantothenate kinase [Candidatus Thermoplasmatota archaeon]